MLSKVQQQIAVTGRSMAQDTPQMKILNAQADNLRSQIASMQSQIAGTNETPRRTLADQLGKLSTQSLILKTAQQQYANAAVQFESARMEMETQHSYLVNFIPPSLPQKALYPKRWWSWSLIVFPAALLWSIIFGLGHLVRDHMAG
jgi:capsular polysaccharide transport system permease protein